MSLLYCGSAWAAPGDHIPVGHATFAPRVALGVEYSSNVAHEEVLDTDSGATNLKLSPGFDLRLARPDVDLGLGATYELRKYFTPDDVAYDRYNDFRVRLDIDALKESVVGVRATEAFGLQNFPVDAESPDQRYTSQFRNLTTAAIAVRPGPAIELRAGGQYGLDIYQTAAAGSGDDLRHYNTRQTYGPAAGIAWKIIRRTALVLEFAYDHSQYTIPVLTTDGGTDLYFPDHDMLRLEAGLRGRVTDRTVVTLLGGYGSANFHEDSIVGISEAAATDLTGLEHLLVEGSLRYDFSEKTSATIGFDKDFRQSFFTNYVAYTKGFAGTDILIGESVGVGGQFSVASEQYRGQIIRDDVVLGLGVDFTYQANNWASFEIGPAWLSRSSSDGAVDYSEFTAHALLNFVY